MTRNHFNSYEPRAELPAVGSTWVWEPNKLHAREDITVTEVTWNGEEWWVKTRTNEGSEHVNDLGRFWEACFPLPDPNTMQIGKEICWHGRPSFAKDTPSGWRNTSAASMRWSKIGQDLWKRVA